MDDEGTLRITITPEPTEDERDAIVAALTVLLLADEPTPEVHSPLSSRWTRTGRIEALRGIHGRPDRGWGRDHL